MFFLATLVLAFPAPAQRAVVLPAQVSVQGQSGAETTGRWPNHRGALLFFLDRECPVSNGYAPEMARLAQLARNGKLAVLGIHSDPSTSIQEAVRHAKEHALGFDVVVDHAQRLATASGVAIVPQAVIADPEGRIVYRGRINDQYTPDGNRLVFGSFGKLISWVWIFGGLMLMVYGYLVIWRQRGIEQLIASLALSAIVLNTAISLVTIGDHRFRLPIMGFSLFLQAVGLKTLLRGGKAQMVDQPRLR